MTLVKKQFGEILVLWSPYISSSWGCVRVLHQNIWFLRWRFALATAFNIGIWNKPLAFVVICFSKGTSAYAGPRYQKLYGRVTRVWSNRRGQPKRSAMQEPRPGRSPLVIRFASPSGKYALKRIQSGVVRASYLLRVVQFKKCLPFPGA